MQIGITISTFNRKDFLDLSLWHWNKYSNNNSNIIVIDDGSYEKEQNENICKKYDKVKYIYQENQGISKTKTRGLSELKNNDYIFLSDDDCYPIKKNYENIFIESYEKTNNHHFMILEDEINNHSIHGPKKEVFEGIESYNNCGGILLFITKECLNTIGGFDNRMKFYGYEHAQWSNKIHENGFTPLGKYLCPIKAKDYFFSIDFDHNWRGLKSEKWDENLNIISSVFTTEEKKNSYKESISYNSSFFGDYTFYTPL